MRSASAVPTGGEHRAEARCSPKRRIRPAGIESGCRRAPSRSRLDARRGRSGKGGPQQPAFEGSRLSNAGASTTIGVSRCRRRLDARPNRAAERAVSQTAGCSTARRCVLVGQLCRSRRSRSHGVRAIAGPTSAAISTSPTTLTSGWSFKSDLRPSRKSAWSSAMMIRSIRRREGRSRGAPRPAPRRRAAPRPRPRPHGTRSTTAARSPPGSRRRRP